MAGIKGVLEDLRSAPARYRSAPFWAWNDDLDEKRLERQVELFREQGISGFFIHSREGLETPYLSQIWMDRVGTVLPAAEKADMEVWIYDEDKWPSGSAGGAVSSRDPEHFSAKAVTLEVIELKGDPADSSILDTLRDDHSIISSFWVERDPEDSNVLIRYERFLPDNIPDHRSGELLLFRIEISGLSEWYNHHAPSDNLNPDAVKCFIGMTHEDYEARFSEYFGKRIKGFFTDEPNICDFFATYTEGRPWLPWSGLLPLRFRETCGYEITDVLPLLFFHGDGEEKVRYDYWLSLTELFVDSYTRQLHDWCDDHRLELTGHMIYENDLGYGIRCNGAVMPHYRYMHAPGIDLLGDQRKEYLTVKQCTSVANQFRRKTVFSETYGTTGWDFSFAGQKRIGDWQFVMGVNRRCQHLALYSISGCRKRDYPPSFNYQNTNWEYSHVLEDYFARLSVCVSTGTVHRDILMIHPVSTFWMRSGSSIDEDLSKVYMNMGWLDEHITEINREGDFYNRLAEELLCSQFDFDLGDELIMREASEVIDKQLQVGSHRYSYVIIPPVKTLMGSTGDLLLRFLEAGGTVLWMKPFPVMIDAVYADALLELTGHDRVIPIDSAGELIDVLKERVERPVEITSSFGRDLPGFLSMTRDVEDGKIITIVNTNDHPVPDCAIAYSCTGSVKELDLMKGILDTRSVVHQQGRNSVRTSFEPEETKVFLIDSCEEPLMEERDTLSYIHPHAGLDLVYAFPPVTQVRLTCDNALSLDRCRLRIGDSPWSEESFVWTAQKQLREQLGMQQIHYNGAPQRYLWIDERPRATVTQQFRFQVEEIPEGSVYAAIEKSEDLIVRCNGIPCSLSDEWFIDEDIQKHRIPGLSIGLNTIEIEYQYTSAVELEDIYITGQFGVSPSRKIISYPERLQRGDWTLQGLTHYPGSCIYEYQVPPLEKDVSGRKLMLKIGEFKGSLAVIRIDDHEPLYAFRAGTLRVDGLIDLSEGSRIGIEIVGNLRNLLGPLHRSAKTCSRESWEDFHPAEGALSPDYHIEPLGLSGEVFLFLKD